MAPDKNDGLPGNGLNRDLDHIFEGMAQSELERLTIEALREYRASVALAETAQLNLTAAEADADQGTERLVELQRAHQRAQTDHRARQLVLNNLIDRLGYVPKIPAG